MLTQFKNFALGFCTGILALIAGYILMFSWFLARARYSGFEGQVGLDPVSFISRPFGLVTMLLLFAIGFWFPIRKKISHSLKKE